MGCFCASKSVRCSINNKIVNEEGGTIAVVFRRLLLPLQKLQSLKVEIVNINDFAHVVKMALQLYDLADFAIATDCSFFSGFQSFASMRLLGVAFWAYKVRAQMFEVVKIP